MKECGERSPPALSSHLHAIGKPHTRLDVLGSWKWKMAFAVWYFLRRLEVQFGAMLAQPGAPVAIVRALLSYQRPEAR